MITPTRASYRDVSLKRFKAYPIYQWRYFSDDLSTAGGRVPVSHTSTGIERDAMESFELGVAFPQAIVHLQDHQPGGGADEYATGELSIILRLASIYEAKALAQGGWAVGDKGRYYQKDQHICFALQGALRAAGVKSVPQGLLDLVDLDASGKYGAPGFSAPPPGPFVPGNANIGEIHTHVHLPKLTKAQLALLDAVEAAHHTHGDPLGAHLAFEASAVDIQQSAFFKMRDFWGHVNRAWSPAEAALIDQLRDVKHADWTRAVKALDWTRARIASTDHLQAHLLGNLGKTPSTMLYRFSRPGLGHNQWPALTWQEVLADATLLKAA